MADQRHAWEQTNDSFTREARKSKKGLKKKKKRKAWKNCKSVVNKAWKGSISIKCFIYCLHLHLSILRSYSFMDIYDSPSLPPSLLLPETTLLLPPSTDSPHLKFSLQALLTFFQLATCKRETFFFFTKMRWGWSYTWKQLSVGSKCDLMQVCWSETCKSLSSS